MSPAAKSRRSAAFPRSRSPGRAAWAMSLPHPGFAGNQRVYLSFVEAGEGGTSGAALGYGTSMLGQGRTADRGVQGHLAPDAEGDRQRPFRAPHRLRARRNDFPVVGRAAEIRPGAGVRRQSRQDPPPDRRRAAGPGRPVRRSRRRRGANSTRWAIATISASRSRPTGGCGRPRWAPRAATNSI